MRLLRIIAVCCVTLGVASAPINAAPLFTLETLPAGGTLVGQVGVATGWGYQVHNPDPINWLELTDVTADPFLHGSATVLFDFPILQPGQTVTVPWVPGLAGLLEHTFNPGAALGSQDVGVFTIGGVFWTDDPFNPGAMQVALATPQMAPYSVTNGTIAVPEPSVVALILLGVAHHVRRRAAAARR